MTTVNQHSPQPRAALRNAALQHYLAEVASYEGNREWLTAIRYLGGIAHDEAMDDELGPPAGSERGCTVSRCGVE